MNVIVSGADGVIAACPLPAQGKLNNVSLNIQGITSSISPLQAVMYGISGFVVPVMDPDAASSVDLLWDTLIPKDVESSAAAFDLDTAAAETSPEFEWGEVDLEHILDIGGAPVEIFQRRGLLTYAGAQSRGFESGSPDTWIPTISINAKVKRNVVVEVPSMVLFGFSNPVLGDTTASPPTSPTETQWPILTYLEDFLVDAVKQWVGLTETGAESPYEEAAAFIADYIEPDAFEETAGAFQSNSWSVFSKCTFDVTVPGSVNVGPLGSG
jgi:hypothetical protein